ncbi:MAG: cytochrome c biogenesis protein ResB [Peptococcaceae bacterium]|nr:cytochrome c biogenesis protein ResB [Peptococcaceae bacterium]
MLRFISSVRLAVILIAALAGLAVAATVYDLPEMYQSWPFRIFSAAFFINLLTCSVQQWPKVARTLRRKPESLIGSEAYLTESTLDKDGLFQALKNQRYKVQSCETDHGTFILARQHVPAIFAAHILHVGLLIIIIGAFLSSFAVTGQLMLYPGESQPLPNAITERVGEGVITVSDFTTDYDDSGDVENWVTTFDLSLGDNKVAENATTRVNHPYKEHGLSIYQMAYRNMYVVHIEGDESVAGDYAIPESQRFVLGEQSVDIEPMTDGIALLYIFDKDNNEIGSYAFKEGTTINIDDQTTIEYIQPLSATVLEFKYSHAIPVIFAGFIVATLGSLLMLLGRYGELHAFVSKDGAVSLRVINKSVYLRRRQRKKFGIIEQTQEDEEKKC